MERTANDLLDRMSRTLGRQSSRRWWDLSQQAQRVALGGDPTDLLGRFELAAGSEDGSPLQPAFRLSRADAVPSRETS